MAIYEDDLRQLLLQVGDQADREVRIPDGWLRHGTPPKVVIEVYSPRSLALDASLLLAGTQRLFAISCVLGGGYASRFFTSRFSGVRDQDLAMDPWALDVVDLRVGSIYSKMTVIGRVALLEFQDKPVATAASFLTACGLVAGGAVGVLAYYGPSDFHPSECRLELDAPNVDAYQDFLTAVAALPKDCSISITLTAEDGSSVRGHTSHGPP